MSFKFREHRGSLAASMETCVELADRQALVEHCASLLRSYAFEFDPSELLVIPYGRDDRIDWDTHIVTIERYGVMGFTDIDPDQVNEVLK